MVALRALVVFLILDAQSPEKPFHIPHILAVFIAGLIQAFFGHGTNLADNLCIAFVIGEPPVLDFGELPDCSEGGAESGGDDVSITHETLVPVRKHLKLSCTYPFHSIMAILRRAHIWCLWSLGRNMDAMPMLFLNPMQCPFPLSGQRSIVSIKRH